MGVFRIEGDRGKDNETGLNEKREIETLYLLTYFTRNSAVQKSKIDERIEQM